jgi:hypothetical protein
MTVEKVSRFDRGLVRGDATVTEEGYIRANAVVTRTGIFLYSNADGSIRRELRHPDDVWDSDSIASMELIPVTNNHPDEKLVNAKNFKKLAIGYTGETIKKDGDYILANVVISDQDGVDWIKNQGRKELSLGYTVDLHPEAGSYNGEPYDFRQKNIRYNHLAIVNQARAGGEARIALDSQDTVEILTEVEQMAKRKIKIDEEEVMVEPQTADYVDRLLADLKNLEDEKKRVDDEIRMIRDKLDKTEAERDSYKERVDNPKEKDGATVAEAKMDSAGFNKAVQERVRVLKCAEETLEKSKRANLDSMSDLDIKKAIIGQCRKSISLDGKSPAYVEAMFDTILDEKTSAKVNVDNVDFVEKDSKFDGESPTAKARQKMMEDQKNMINSKGDK